MRGRCLLLLVFLLSGLLLGACGDDDADEPGSTAAPSAPPAGVGTATATPAVATATATVAPSPTSTQAPAPATAPATVSSVATATQAAEPTATAGDTGNSDGFLTVIEQGFSVSEQYNDLSWGFIIENPDEALAVSASSYYVEAFDAAGNALDSTDGEIELVQPGEQLGISGHLFIDADDTAERIEVEVQSGSLIESPLDPGLAVANITFYPDPDAPIVTGTLSTSLDRPLQYLEVYAIARDDSGQIVGGDTISPGFLDPAQPLGVEVDMPISVAIATVELYAAISYATLNAEQFANADAQPLVVLDKGWGPSRNPDEVGWGFVVENPNATFGTSLAIYHVAVFAADGSVLSAHSFPMAELLPGQRLGVGGESPLPPGTTATSVEVQVFARSYPEFVVPTGTLTAETDASVLDGIPTSITGVVHNTFANDIDSIIVYAVAYDANDQIIGGGYVVTLMVPAGGDLAIDIPTVLGSQPARVELFPGLINLSDIS